MATHAHAPASIPGMGRQSMCGVPGANSRASSGPRPIPRPDLRRCLLPMEVTSHPQPSAVRHTLDTVRVLHDTILTLRQALEGSKKEINDLQSKIKTTEKMEDSESKDVDETGDEEGEEDVFEEGPFRVERPESDDDIDDIELVFTTGETDPDSINEDLVSIQDGSTRTMHTVLVETDISKCGVVEELEAGKSRRNTLPSPQPYRPIMHRELLGGMRGPTKGKATPFRPVPKRESGAQTDITALPGQWKSETYLAHKISYNLTTLPSKFTLPVPRANQVPLSNKTREARRVLLSDINFTSMVPELSRSADHLHKEEEDTSQELCKNYPRAFDYMKSFDVGRDGKTGRCCELTRHGSRSSWGSYYGSRCQASSTSIAQPPPCPCCDAAPRRRHSWRPPSSSVCCHHPGLAAWSSVPSSPTRCSARLSAADPCRKMSNIRICHPHVHPGQSLPDLRDMDSDSTDSLVDEAEDFLRHQIDAMMIGRRGGRNKRARRMSEAYSLAGKMLMRT